MCNGSKMLTNTNIYTLCTLFTAQTLHGKSSVLNKYIKYSGGVPLMQRPPTDSTMPIIKLWSAHA